MKKVPAYLRKMHDVLGAVRVSPETDTHMATLHFRGGIELCIDSEEDALYLFAPSGQEVARFPMGPKGLTLLETVRGAIEGLPADIKRSKW